MCFVPVEMRAYVGDVGGVVIPAIFGIFGQPGDDAQQFDAFVYFGCQGRVGIDGPESGK